MGKEGCLALEAGSTCDEKASADMVWGSLSLDKRGIREEAPGSLGVFFFLGHLGVSPVWQSGQIGKSGHVWVLEFACLF